MKQCFRMSVFTLAAMLVSGCGAAEQNEPTQPAKPTLHALRAANWEDLLHASCTLYVTNYPFGSGVLLGVDQPKGPPKICLLTAAHVAMNVLENAKESFYVETFGPDGRLSAFFETRMKDGKCIPFLPSDLFAIDVTEDIQRFARKHGGLSTEYISLNAQNQSAMPDNNWWCGVLRYADFAKHDIRLGTPCKWLGSNLWMWRRFEDKRESSLCLFDGSIAALPKSKSFLSPHPVLTNSFNVFATTVNCIHGMSGGPVFAMGKTEDGREYPYLIGIGVSQMISDVAPLLAYRGSFNTMTNFVAFTNRVVRFPHTDNDKGSYVCPLDPFLDFLSKSSSQKVTSSPY